ncbi:MAG: diguanylate cyclase [Candidatus Marinarcus sp.]|uniref:diguanylate cyclase n=1 Tax=Candidatus Marinarcus sp. TaxID=3100987 RepID=UPI003AFFD2DB
MIHIKRYNVLMEFSLLKYFLMFFLLIQTLYAQNHEQEKVTLQLEWKYQFQYAGFIMAKEKGFYKDVNLEVELLEYQNGIDIVEKVLNHEVDFGMSNNSLMYKNGVLQPVVLLATYFQKSPLVFIAQKGINSPVDFVGKTIMGTDDELSNSSLSLLLEHFFISGKNAFIVPHSFNIDDFINKDVDVMSAFTSNQLYVLDKLNVPYNIINPAQYGFITNASNLFSTYEEAVKNPAKIENFLSATKRGWEYAFAHLDETIHVIHDKYKSQKSIEALLYEANVTKDLMLLGLYDIGETNKELAMRTYKQLVKSEKVFPHQIQGYFTFKDIQDAFKNYLVSFTQVEKGYLLKKGVLKLCVDPDWMPFESIHNGKYVGISSDIFKLIQQNLDINMELYPTKTWAQSMEAAKKRECDIFTLASQTPDRSEYMNFTDSYIDLPIVMATQVNKAFVDNFYALENKKIGAVKGYAIAQIMKSRYPNIEVVEVDNITQGLQLVESGKLYGYVDNLMVIAYYIQKDFTRMLKISSRLNENVELAIGTRNDEPLLHNIFQKLIRSVSETEKQKIYNQWVSVEESVDINYSLVYQIIGLFLLLLAFFLYHYSQLRKYNHLLKLQSHTDTLTQLSNRLKLDEVLSENYNLAVRYNQTCGIILLDIDDFKLINDTYGHLMGDEVLKKMANVLKQHVRNTDVVGRWGGEEFLIICPNTSIENLENLAVNLRKKIEVMHVGEVKKISASFGVGLIDPEQDIEKLLQAIDEALYYVKKNGKNQVRRVTASV